MDTTKKTLVGLSNFQEEELGDGKSSDVNDDETSDKSFDKDYIKHCLDDDYLQKHFTEIRFIGEGGFGCVFAAKHIIDSKKYALKLVPINLQSFENHEVEVLSAMDHNNVILYYTSWIIKHPKSIIYRELSSSEEDLDGKTFEDGDSSSSPCTFNDKSSLKSKSTCKSTEDMFNDKTFGRENESPNQSPKGCVEDEIYDACLVIQTELCDTEQNLKTLIDNDHIFKMEDTRKHRLVLDIVMGLRHIHDKGFMHRDLKPSNIFLGKDYCAKIGDFGFARNYIMPVTTVTDENSSTFKKEGISLSRNIGTTLYIAPEVRNTTSYDKRVDLYSLGMIVFELFHKMNSGMERIETMQRLREQNFVDLSKIPEKYGNVREIVKSLLNHNPSMRMDLKRVASLMTTPLAYQQRLRRTPACSSHPCRLNGQDRPVLTLRYRQKM